MVVSITKVVNVVSCDRVLCVVKCAHIGALASTREICFQGWCSGVENRYSVGIVCPDVSEVLLQLFVRELLERSTLRLRNLIKLKKLLVRNSTRKNALNNICSVEAVHAVGPEHTPLCLHNFTSLICNGLALVQSNLHFCDEASVVC